MRVTLRIAILCLAVALPGAAMAQSLEERLAVADPVAGEKVFRRCMVCHTVDEGGANKTGPHLWGVVGRPVASVDGFKYSKPMQNHGGAWTPELLDRYLTRPSAEVKGTRMAFGGIKKEGERADLIAFLNSMGPAPLDFSPAPAEEAVEPASLDADADEAVDDGPEIGRFVPGPGAEEAFIYCTACHSEMIVIQQGKTRDHWDDLFGWMVDEQGMDPIDEPDRSVLLDYLAENYNEDRPNFPR